MAELTITEIRRERSNFAKKHLRVVSILVSYEMLTHFLSFDDWWSVTRNGAKLDVTVDNIPVVFDARVDSVEYLVEEVKAE
jgi:hypothetical protein